MQRIPRLGALLLFTVGAVAFAGCGDTANESGKSEQVQGDLSKAPKSQEEYFKSQMSPSGKGSAKAKR